MELEWHINLRRYLGPRRFDRFRQITEAAILSFTEHGYAGSSIATITDIANLQRTQFYFFYENIEDCFTACHRLCLTDMEARIRDASADASVWEEALRLAVEMTVDAIESNPHMVRMVLMDVEFIGTEADQAFRDEAHSNLARALESVFREITDPGIEVTPLMMDIAIGSIREVLSRALTSPSHDRSELTFDLMLAILSAGVGPTEARRIAQVQLA